jgi:O-antigen/teichoic acid export membrane protein
MAKKKSLKQKAASGMIWTTIQKFSKTGIQFVAGIVLARLLTPFDYGCIGMLAIFMALAEQFIDGGFGAALIQKKKPTEEDYSTIFYWNLCLAIVMYVLLYCSAPAIARFYKIPLLCDVLRVQGIILFIYALNIVQKSILRKQLKFKILAIVRIITSIIALIVTISVAFLGFGVWALVIQNLIGAVIPMIAFWIYTKWRPRFLFSRKSFKELFGFGFFMFLTHLINRFGTQLQGLLIGRLYDPTTLGFYSKAQNTERLASHSISDVMASVTYPLYAEVQDDMPRMHNMIKRLSSTVFYITCPILAILLLTAKPLFIILYSERWAQSIPYFQVLCIAGMGICLSAVNTQPIAAIGKSKVMFTWTVLKRIIGILVMVFGLLCFGMYGLLYGAVFNCWFAYFINIFLVSKYIGYNWTKQVADLLPIGLSVLIAGGISYVCGSLLGLNMYADGVVKLVIFLLLFMGWSHFFKPESYLYTKSIVTPILNKYKKKFK